MVAAPTSTGELHAVSPGKRLAWLLPWLFLAPALTIYVIVVVYPMVYSAYLSFLQMGWRFADEAICWAAKLPDAFAE